MSQSSSDFSTLDVHALLEQRRQVAIVWSIEDVQSVRPDLTDDESWAVLQHCRKVHDCNHGFTWDLIAWVARSLFPETGTEGAGR